MKKLLFTLLSVFILFSCSKDNESATQAESPFKADQYPQKWQLVKMTGMVANVPPATGTDMEWQEYYLLQSDGTFIKSRDRKNRTITVNGTYKFVETSEGTYIVFTHESESTLICNCSTTLTESLRVNSEKELIATCWACDGPGLFYERIE